MSYKLNYVQKKCGCVELVYSNTLINNQYSKISTYCETHSIDQCESIDDPEPLPKRKKTIKKLYSYKSLVNLYKKQLIQLCNDFHIQHKISDNAPDLIHKLMTININDLNEHLKVIKTLKYYIKCSDIKLYTINHYFYIPYSLDINNSIKLKYIRDIICPKCNKLSNCLEDLNSFYNPIDLS